MSPPNTVTTTGPDCGLVSSLPSMRQRRLQPRHADGEAGRRHRLAAEARDQSVVTPAAADRAEPHRPALLVLGLERAVQPRRPGRCSIRGRGRRRDRCDRSDRMPLASTAANLDEFIEIFRLERPCFRAHLGSRATSCIALRRMLASRLSRLRPACERCDNSRHDFDRRHQSRALGEVAALILAPRAEQLRTPSTPSRSSLSIARSTVSRLPAFSSPPMPIASITPSSTLRLFTFTTYCRAECRALPSCPPPSCTSRRRRPCVGAPTVSASNCMNWRKRPGPGFSLRNTQPKR